MQEPVQIIQCDIPDGMTCNEYRQTLGSSKKNFIIRLIKAVTR